MKLRLLLLFIICITISILFVLYYHIDEHNISGNNNDPLQSTESSESTEEEITEMSRIMDKINAGKDYIHHGNPLCFDKAYKNDLNDFSKASFVVLISDSWNLNYLRGLLVWIHQLHDLHTKPPISITIAIDENTLEAYGGNNITEWFHILGATHIIKVDLIRYRYAKKKAWQNIYTKLRLFDPRLYAQYGFKQIAYFDADSFPLQSMYELFNIPCSYFLGAVNGMGANGVLNAGFLVIRPNEVVYNTLMHQFELLNLIGNATNKGTHGSEQEMINQLFAGKNQRHGKYWYEFPYEYNTPWWQNRYNDDFAGVEAQKNIHNKIWVMSAAAGTGNRTRKYQQMWDYAWNQVWDYLPNKNRMRLDLCTHPNLWNKEGICTMEMIDNLIVNI